MNLNEEQLDRLSDCIGKELRYDQLCESIGISKKYGNSKNAQLNDLQMYCDYEITKNPTRYIVHEVYAEEVKALGLLHANNKFQLAFDYGVYDALASNNGNDLYLSDSDTLRLFGEVNDNFSYACNQDLMDMLGEDYSWMPTFGLTVNKILNQWTKRRLANMEARCLFIRRVGFRVYKELDNGAVMISNVPEKSDLEKICQEVYHTAANKIMPPDWGDEGRGRYWVNKETWLAFEREISHLIYQRTDGIYTNMKRISIITPTSKEYLQQQMATIRTELPNINEEVQRKILTTKTLSCFKPYKKQQFIDVNIKPNPYVSLKEEIKKRAN